MASLSAGKALSLAAHGEGLLYAAFGIVTNDGRNVGQVLTNSPELLGTSIKGIGAEYKQAARAARNVLLALEILGGAEHMPGRSRIDTPGRSESKEG